ncbi:MAG: signal peptidase I [Nanohaloarchaea archaeon]|nr:signal peptidase I [Candidatus Nanohaloarchaea archaeon]
MNTEDIVEKLSAVKSSREFKEYYFFAIALILAFGTLQTAGSVTNTDRPVVTVVSCSMYPDYDVGDIIGVQGTGYENIEVGDVIVYDVPKKVEFTVGGERHVLNDSNAADYTEAGAVKLLQVEGDSKAAIVSIDGQNVKMIEGKSFDYGGQSFEVNSISGMDIPVIHRVIRKNSDHLETQGDNTLGQHEFEKNIEPEQIYGEAVFKIPRIGLVKILAIDILGIGNNAPLTIDSTPDCQVRP